MIQTKKKKEKKMILIDINMPDCCDKCPLYDDRWDYPTCYVTQEMRGYTFNIREKRMPGCPLKDITRIPKPESLGWDICGGGINK